MDSREYWQIRALLQEQAAKEKGDKFLKDLAKMYNISLKEIQKDIEKWFKRYAKEEGITLAEAQKRLTSGEIIGYQLAMEEVMDETENESFQKYLRHKYMSERITRLDSLKNQVSVQLELLAESKDVQTFEYLKSTYKDNVFLNKETIDIQNTFHKFSETAIEQTVSAPWSGKSFSDRIWTDTEKLIDEVQEVISVGLVQGHDIDKMSRKIARRMEVSQNRAKTLVRTETNYILSQATFDTYKNFEVEQYEFLATLDYKTSEICQSLDKKVFFVKDRQVGVNCNPMHPNCRSTTIPYFEDGVEGMRIAKGADGKSYYIKDSISYREWYDSLSTEERKQLEVLKKKDKNRNSDSLQYGRYKKLIGKDNIPKTFDEFQNLKYNDSEKWEELKLLYQDEKLKKNIRENYNLSIHQGSQDKHILETNNYKQELANGRTKSYLLDGVNPQELVYQYAGTGEIKRNLNTGEWLKKEFCEHIGPVGYVVDLVTKEKRLTNRFSIHYSKKGTHIVPRD